MIENDDPQNMHPPQADGKIILSRDHFFEYQFPQVERLGVGDLINPRAHLFTKSLTQSLTHHSFIHAFTHSFTNSITLP